ncbi:MAG: PD-(D/E)XK nuclease-like domain-containing protein [Anaerolineae bacterium]|nr:PD-(D/E)XK nuclease-like domain-containing protein [Anaerolineae bacterium]
MPSPAVPTFITHEPAEMYHARSGEFLTSHLLADFRKCPLLYHWRRQGLAPREDRPAYLIGRAAHTLILEGRPVFEREYAAGGPINPQTGKPYDKRSKAFAEWAERQGKPVLGVDDVQLVEHLRAGVMAHDGAREILASGVAEGVVRAEYRGVPCQIRLDWFNPDLGLGLVDLKTADSLDWFEADARRFGYAHQLAFYRAVFAAAAGKAPLDVPVHLIAVEKKEPFRCGLWRVGEDVLATAQKDNEAAIDRLKRCLQAGTWPTGYEQVRAFDWL